MKKCKLKSPKGIAVLSAIIAAVIALIVLGIFLIPGLVAAPAENIEKVPTQEEYFYVNPDETKAQTDPGLTIDGVLDEEIYSGKNWLYLTNDDAGNHVNIAMTSHFGQEGMYFVFDVTESVPIYVNLDRAATLNSCIELYLAPPHVNGVQENTVFEIDLLPTGDMSFKRSNGKYGYENVATSNDTMAYLGATTKGGPVNTTECYGYALELFIPWSYMQWLGQDVDAMKDSYVLINPAHITSNNLTGTDHNLDRYWYHYAQQIGAGFTSVSQYFRFNADGVIGTTRLTLEEGEHYTFQGNNVGFPGMQIPITVVPDAGYALTSITVDGQEQMNRVSYNQDGSVTLKIRCTGGAQKITAAVEAVTEGPKTLSGKVHLNGAKDVLVSYVGPLGEKPVTIDKKGNFIIENLEPGYYEIRVEKQGSASTSRGIYLNRDVYTELTVSDSIFTTTSGTCWILDEASYGILYKMKGNGDILSNEAYQNFTLETYVRFDTELAKQGSDDYHLQQRSGVRILFSNGKYWHIDLLSDNDRFVVQFGKITGDKSIFNWTNVHALTQEQIAKYTGADGIKLTVIRVGNKAAICLDDEVLFVEELAQEYADYTAQLGFEAWIANNNMMRIPYSIVSGATLPEAPKTYFYSASTWDVTQQSQGIVYKTGVAGVDTWLDSAIVANDITTVARDLDPAANDYSMIYIFKFSNGEQFRVRLNHTDNDGKYRIQSMASSTLFDPWKNHYTLTDEQAQKAQGDGIAFRVWISGTTAYVYLDGQQVCTYDLSRNVATGQPSGIDQATVHVHLRLDGCIGQTVEIPFVLVQTDAPAVEPDQPDEPEVPVDPEKQVTLNINSFENGSVTPGKTVYAVGDTVTLTVAPAAGYAQKLYINGKPLMLDWQKNTYSFVATEKVYAITGTFEKSLYTAPMDAARWDAANQAHGVLNTYYPNNNDSWYMDIKGDYQSISVIAKNYMGMAETAENTSNTTPFQFVLRVTMDNGKVYAFRVFNKQQIDGTARYEYNRFGAGGSVTGWGGWTYVDTKNAAAAEALNGDGAEFKLERTGGNTMTVSINGTILDSYVLDGVTADNKVVSMGMSHQGNVGCRIEIPFAVEEPAQEPPVVEPPVEEPPVSGKTVEIKIPAFENGTVTPARSVYTVGETVRLVITANAGYTQKLYINGEPVILDWRTNTYSFAATEESYTIDGSFVSALNAVASDSGRWDLANQAHGSVTTYYPNNNDSWYLDIQGEYESIAINVKNYWSVAESYEGIANGGGFRIVLRMTLDNGKNYAFSIWIDTNKRYAYNHFGGGNSATGWSGAWCLVSDKNAEATAALNGDGAEFKLERIDGNHIQITFGGTVLETYTIPNVTAANKVVSVGLTQYGNRGEFVEIPFEVK